MLPIFRDMESYQGEADEEYRGRGGPLKVTESNETGPLYDALIKAAGEVGIAYTKDYNGAQQDGIGMTQTTIRSGRRMSTAVCYLDPARRRPNLTIQAERADRMPAARRQAVHRRALQRQRSAARGPRAPGGHRQCRFDQFAAASGTVRHRSAGAAAGTRHRGPARTERRRRKPARSLFTADEMDCAGVAWYDLQRQGARPGHGEAGAEIRADATRGCWDCRPRRSARMSAPGGAWMRRTRRSPGCRSW